MGLGQYSGFCRTKKTETPTATYGTLIEKSKGKDTTTGHWGNRRNNIRQTICYIPRGFPQRDLLTNLLKETNCGGI